MPAISIRRAAGGGGAVDLDDDLDAIANLAPNDKDVIQYQAGGWNTATPAVLKGDMGAQTASPELDDIAALTPTDDDVLQRKAGAWTSRTPAQVKTDLALGNVDNTSDAAKPVSTAQQTALDAKQPLNSDLTAIAAIAATNDDVIQRKGGAWVNRTPAQLKADMGITDGASFASVFKWGAEF